MHDNEPAGVTPPAEPSATAEAHREPAGRASGTRRMIASLLLAIGLLTVGGVAIVSAASPHRGPPRPRPHPEARAARAARHAPAGNCPNM